MVVVRHENHDDGETHTGRRKDSQGEHPRGDSVRPHFNKDNENNLSCTQESMLDVANTSHYYYYYYPIQRCPPPIDSQHAPRKRGR